MELDNIKHLWKEENIEKTPEISTEKQQEIHSPLDKIRKNMQTEFWTTLLMLPVLIMISLPYMTDSRTSTLLVLIFMIMILIVGYYFLKFRTLYKRISTQNFSTYTNLVNLRYELVLNTELYKSYYLAFLPVMFCVYLIIFDLSFSSVAYLSVLSISTVLAAALLYITGKIWLKEMYGKYIVQISDLIMDLSDENDDFVYNRSSLNASYSLKWVAQTKAFLISKLGENTGPIVNKVIWTIIFLAAMLFLSFLIGYLIGFIGAKVNFFDSSMFK